MVISPDEARGLVLGDAYQGLLNEIKDDYEVAVDVDYEQIFLEMDAESLSLSGVSISDLHKLLAERRHDILSYSINKLKKTHNVDDQQELQQEPDATIEFGSYSQGFLLINLIEFSLAQRGVHFLEKYIKEARIPNAKAYVKEVLSFMLV